MPTPKLSVYEHLLFALAINEPREYFNDNQSRPSGFVEDEGEDGLSSSSASCISTPASTDFSAAAHEKRLKRLELDLKEYERNGMWDMVKEMEREREGLKRKKVLALGDEEQGVERKRRSVEEEIYKGKGDDVEVEKDWQWQEYNSVLWEGASTVNGRCLTCAIEASGSKAYSKAKDAVSIVHTKDKEGRNVTV